MLSLFPFLFGYASQPQGKNMHVTRMRNVVLPTGVPLVFIHNKP